MIRRRFLNLTRRALSGALFATALGVKVEAWKLEEPDTTSIWPCGVFEYVQQEAEWYPHRWVVRA